MPFTRARTAKCDINRKIARGALKSPVNFDSCACKAVIYRLSIDAHRLYEEVPRSDTSSKTEPVPTYGRIDMATIGAFIVSQTLGEQDPAVSAAS